MGTFFHGANKVSTLLKAGCLPLPFGCPKAGLPLEFEPRKVRIIRNEYRKEPRLFFGHRGRTDNCLTIQDHGAILFDAGGPQSDTVLLGHNLRDFNPGGDSVSD